jgi:hypothetical protein
MMLQLPGPEDKNVTIEQVAASLDVRLQSVYGWLRSRGVTVELEQKTSFSVEYLRGLLELSPEISFSTNYIGATEAAENVKLPRDTFLRLTGRGSIPRYVLPSGQFRFRLQDVAEPWLTAAEVAAVLGMHSDQFRKWAVRPPFSTNRIGSKPPHYSVAVIRKAFGLPDSWTLNDPLLNSTRAAVSRRISTQQLRSSDTPFYQYEGVRLYRTSDLRTTRSGSRR